MEAQRAKQIMAVEVEVNACRAEFYINGIPLTLLDAKTAPKESMPVNQYVLDGANDLLIVVEPGPTPSLARTAKKEIRLTQGRAVRMRLARYPEGAFPADPSGAELGRIEWTGKEGEQIEMPFEIISQCNVGVWRGQWSWTRASELRLDSKTLGQVVDLLAQVHTGLAQGNPDVLLRLEATRFAEVCRAFGLDPLSQAAERRGQLTKKVKGEGWAMQDLDPRQFDLRLCANERMIECVARDWQPILRSDKEDGRSFFGLKLAYIDGKLQIVR